MLPASQQQQFLPSTSPDGPLPSFHVDPNYAKQMAALHATSLAKVGNRSAPGGTSASFIGGLSTHQITHPDSSSGQESIMHPFPNSQSQGPQGNPQAMQTNHTGQLPLTPQQRKRQFLNGLSSIQLQRGTPLPPSLTGVQYPPNYDPNASVWKTLEVSPTEPGVVRLAGKDVDLYRLWAIVQQAGGGAKVTQNGLWVNALQPFQLPEQFTSLNGQPQSTAAALAQYYNVIIGPFEEAYRKNVMREQQRALMAARAQSGVAAPGIDQNRPNGLNGLPATFPPVGSLPATNGGAPNVPANLMNGAPQQATDPSNNTSQLLSTQLPQHNIQTEQGAVSGNVPGFNGGMPADIGLQPNTGPEANGHMAVAASGDGVNGTPLSTDGDGDVRGKRKMEEVEEPNKRARQKTGEANDAHNSAPSATTKQASTMNTPARPIRQPSRRKIEYIPLAREVDTGGGRDFDTLQQELNRTSMVPIRDLGEWGNVDLDALTMSFRSRISTELSYALTTFTVLTLLRFKETGFPIAQAPDLFEELLDLVEDTAFDGPEAEDDTNRPPDHPIVTHRYIMNFLLDEGLQPFAGLKPRQGAREPKLGPSQRPGDIILTAFNIIRNLSTSPENLEYLSQHKKLLGILLRITALKPNYNSSPTPLSPVLSLNDLVVLRKDVVDVLVNIAVSVHLSSSSNPSNVNIRNARRVFELLASYMIDPSDAMPPYACMQLLGPPSHIHATKPPSLVDSALEAFTRLSHPDENRSTFSKAISQPWLWSMFVGLVHRVPVGDQDYSVIMRAEWLAYLERVIMSVYSIAFISPPALKKRVKADHGLAFTKVMLRLVKKLIFGSPSDARMHLAITVRRAIETMKLIDDGGDSFSSASSVIVPTLAFGMGYGEHGEAQAETGMGLLSGYQEDITWGLMLQREVDDLMFNELASLVRVEATV